MKTIKKINTFAILLPFFVLLIASAINKESGIFFALLSTMITGFIQIVIALFLILKKYNNYLLTYFILVVMYFGVAYFNFEINLFFDLFFFISVPILLCIYLTIIIYIINQ